MTSQQSPITDRQQFVRSLARRVTHLHCNACRTAPPRFAGGLCDRCETPSARQTGRRPGNPAAASSRP
jgi:hypothetical protein